MASTTAPVSADLPVAASQGTARSAGPANGSGKAADSSFRTLLAQDRDSSETDTESSDDPGLPAGTDAPVGPQTSAPAPLGDRLMMAVAGSATGNPGLQGLPPGDHSLPVAIDPTGAALSGAPLSGSAAATGDLAGPTPIPAGTAAAATGTLVSETLARVQNDSRARPAGAKLPTGGEAPAVLSGVGAPGPASADGMSAGVIDAAVRAASAEIASTSTNAGAAAGGGAATGAGASVAALSARGADAAGAMQAGAAPTPTGAAANAGTGDASGLAPGWEAGVSRQMAWMARGGVQRAEIALNPPHLGPLEVRLTMSQGEASVTFTSGHEVVREALEQSMPRLRDLLGDSGIRLGDAQVGDRGAGQEQQLAGDRDGGSQGPDGRSGTGNEAPADGSTERAELSGAGLVDTYA